MVQKNKNKKTKKKSLEAVLEEKYVQKSATFSRFLHFVFLSWEDLNFFFDNCSREAFFI